MRPSPGRGNLKPLFQALRMTKNLDLDGLRARLAAAQGRAPEPPEEPRQAAVAVVLASFQGDPAVLLIRRSEREGDPWSGHMAFPGGRAEPHDADLLATAVRETREEVGLDLSVFGETIGQLPGIPAMARGHRAGLLVTPFVFALRSVPELHLTPEVDAIVWGKIAHLQSPEAATIYPYSFEGRMLELPAYRVEEHIVWGLTHRMLASFLDLIEEKAHA